MIAIGPLVKRAIPFVIAIGIWFSPVPAGLTPQAWHLFAVFVAAIASVLLGSFPLLTAAMLAVGVVVVTKTITIRPRPGNPPPRIDELPPGALNSIGLESVGLAAEIKD